MNRRNFLQWSLGACALTALQRSEVVRAIKVLPAPPIPTNGAVSRDYLDCVTECIQWRPPVEQEVDLPQDAEDGDARWVMDSDHAHIWVAPVGWLVLAAKEGV